MYKYLSFPKYIILITCIIFAATGCSSLRKAKMLEDMSPEELLQKGLEQSKNGDLARALSSLQTVKARYPYTQSAIVASLKLADTYYEMGEYAMAYDLYVEFERLHPKDVNVPYIKISERDVQFQADKRF